MTRHAKTHQHTFSTNFFGAVGYAAIVFVWLLVLSSIVVISSFSTIVAQLSSSLGGLSSVTYAGASQTAVMSNTPLYFLLVVTLIILAWIFCYMTARLSSGVLRHMFALFGRKVTFESFAVAKYMVLSCGLIGLVILIQFIPALFMGTKFPLAFLGFTAGIVGVGAIWVQHVLAVRHHVAIDRVL